MRGAAKLRQAVQQCPLSIDGNDREEKLIVEFIVRPSLKLSVLQELRLTSRRLARRRREVLLLRMRERVLAVLRRRAQRARRAMLLFKLGIMIVRR